MNIGLLVWRVKYFLLISNVKLKGRNHRLRPKTHILDDPLGNSNDGPLWATLWAIIPYKGPLWPYYPPPKLALYLYKILLASPLQNCSVHW